MLMVEAGVAVQRQAPAWIHISGDIVEDNEETGCQVTHDLIRPEYFFVMNDVGGNTRQKTKW